MKRCGWALLFKRHHRQMRRSQTRRRYVVERVYGVGGLGDVTSLVLWGSCPTQPRRRDVGSLGPKQTFIRISGGIGG